MKNYLNISKNRSTTNDVGALDIIAVLKADYKIVLISVIGASVLFAVCSLLIPNEFRAHATIAPSQSNDFNASQNLGGLGSIASLAGVSLTGGNVSESNLHLEMLTSRAFLIPFIEKEGIAPAILAAERWDPKSKEWVYDSKNYNPDNGGWIKSPSNSKPRKPHQLEYYQAFRKMLSISIDKTTGIITISVTSLSPESATTWLSKLITSANNHVKENDVKQFKENLAFLEDQLTLISNNETQKIFYQLIQEQVHNLMLATVKKNYAFTVLDPAITPYKKDSPKRVAITIAGALLGLLASSAIIIIRAASRTQR